MAAAQVHPTSIVDAGARIGARTRVWHFCHIMGGARIGSDCVLGQNVFVGRDVSVGAGTKIQNNVSVYEGVTIGRRCFLGPSVVFTNVKTPRAEVERKSAFLPTRVLDGASLGANATIVCGTTIGRYAVVGAGAVVTRDVPDHGVVWGVPAVPRGWACHCGAVLAADLGCPDCSRRYALRRTRLVPAQAGGATGVEGGRGGRGGAERGSERGPERGPQQGRGGGRRDSGPRR